MGCLFSKSGGSGGSPKRSTEGGGDAPKQYSWDKREKVDPKDFTIENLKGETVGRLPGTVNGQQFIIQNCEDCSIYIFDHTATVSVDDCTNCRIFLGPIKTSVFIRDCKDCKVAVACQQFRTRDCHKLDVFVSCVSQPIIEATTGVRFGCYQYYYPELEDQFHKAGISVYNNTWSSIHDFTPVTGENNFTLIPEGANLEDYLPIPTAEPFAAMQISLDPDKSPVPRTHGTRRKTSEESCLVVFFSDGLSNDRAKAFLLDMNQNHSGCLLVQSKELTMQPGDAERVFGSGSYAMAVKQGPVIGFEYNGDGVCNACQETCVTVSKGSTGLVFVSASSASASQQIEAFYNFADMQMNAS